jgi:hypothetical protein
MTGLRAMLIVAMFGWAGFAQAAGEQDEAWITRYIASGKAPGLALSPERSQSIGFDQLSRFVGRRVRVDLQDGRERRGIVEKVDESGAVLRSQVAGGFFRYTLSRAETRAIRVD